MGGEGKHSPNPRDAWREFLMQYDGQLGLWEWSARRSVWKYARELPCNNLSGVTLFVVRREHLQEIHHTLHLATSRKLLFAHQQRLEEREVPRGLLPAVDGEVFLPSSILENGVPPASCVNESGEHRPSFNQDLSPFEKADGISYGPTEWKRTITFGSKESIERFGALLRRNMLFNFVDVILRFCREEGVSTDAFFEVLPEANTLLGHLDFGLHLRRYVMARYVEGGEESDEGERLYTSLFNCNTRPFTWVRRTYTSESDVVLSLTAWRETIIQLIRSLEGLGHADHPRVKFARKEVGLDPPNSIP